MKKLSVILLLLLIVSCYPGRRLNTPDVFDMNLRSERPLIEGFILSDITSVENNADNGFIMFPNAYISLREYRLMSRVSDLSIKTNGGDGMMFTIRTTQHERNNEPGIKLLINETGSTVFENNKIIFENPGAKLLPGEDQRLRIRNQGKYYSMSLDCETIYTGTTELPQTEFILIKTLPNTQALVYGIEFDDVFDDLGDVILPEIYKPD